MRWNAMGSKLAAMSIAISAVLTSAAAAAQVGDFGSPGQFVLSGERLAGLFWIDVNTEHEGTADVNPGGGVTNANTHFETDSNGMQFAFLGNDRSVGSVLPRLGFDFFVIQSLSIGGSFIYVRDTDESDTTGTASLPNLPGSTRERVQLDSTRSALVVAPRAGYGQTFRDNLGIWARGGITYATQTEETEVITTTTAPGGGQSVSRQDTTTEFSLWALSLEVLLLIIPVDHFAIGVGPFVDFPLSGSIDLETTTNGNVSSSDGDLSATTFGLTVGLVGWL